MNRYTVAPQAEDDLLDVWTFVAHGNPGAADRLIDTFYNQFRTLAKQPGMGRRRPEFRGGNYRSFPIGNYIVFYEPFDDHIEIARVLHGARDLPSLLD